MIRFLTCMLLSSTLLLTGCSYLKKGKDAILPKGKTYLNSVETPPLQAPAGMQADSMGDTYAIPPATGPAPTAQPSLLPPGSLAEQIAQGKVSPDVLKEKPAPVKKSTSKSDTNRKS